MEQPKTLFEVFNPSPAAPIHSAICRALSKPSFSRPIGPAPKFYCSEFGRCLRKALLRVTGTPGGGDFPPHLREVMNLGNAYETDTLNYLTEAYGRANVQAQVPLNSLVWSGRADAVIRTPTEEMIIEHKATGDKYFNYNDTLPKGEHIAQLWLYGQLFQEACGRVAKLILYYRAWGHWAEFALIEQNDDLLLQGAVNGASSTLTRYGKARVLREERELWEMTYRLRKMPPVPEPSDSCGCTFQGAPTCGYYKICFPGEVK